MLRWQLFFYAESIKLLGRIEFNGIFSGNESVYRESHYPLLELVLVLNISMFIQKHNRYSLEIPIHKQSSAIEKR